MRHVALLVVAACAIACVSTNAAVMNETLIRPAISPDSVVIYLAPENVPRKYDEVAVLNSKGNEEWTSESKMYKSMRQSAAKLGANGVIVAGMKDPSTGAKIARSFGLAAAYRKGQAIAIFVHPVGADSSVTASH